MRTLSLSLSKYTSQHHKAKEQLKRKLSLVSMESSSSFSSSFSFHGTSLEPSDLKAGFCECTVKTHPLCTQNDRRRVVVRSGLRRYESRFFYDACNDSHDAGDSTRHFLDACFLCKKSLAGNRDIFMYRGDIPFCSEECRQVQIETDETKEKNSKYPAKATSGKPEQQQQQQQQEQQQQQQQQKQSSQRIPVSAW